MPTLPLADPGVPDLRSPWRYLAWTGRRQLPTLLGGMAFGILWLATQALMPFAVGRAIEEGIVEDDGGRLALWSGVLLGLGCVQAAAGAFRHRFAVTSWLIASFRFVQLVGGHAARAPTAVRAAHSTGEVVATVSNDALRAGGAFDVTARLAGAVVSYVIVAALLLTTSTTLGLVVLLGVPTLVLTLGGVIRPLHRRQHGQRVEVGELMALGADTAAGLRVLRGIGGEEAFLGRYREQSERVRVAGNRVANPQATLDSMQVLLPGLFVLLVTWLGARLVLDGRIGPGDLVAFYGYAAFLVIPLRTGGEAVERFTRAHVGARRMLDVLRVEPHVHEPAAPEAPPPVGSMLVDERSGVVVEPGRFLCLASARPGESVAVVDRLGRFALDGEVTFGGISLGRLATADFRRRVLVSEAEPLLFSGSLRSELDPRGVADDEAIRRAIAVAAADDVVAALADGFEEHVDERGRSFSGGQRQRLVLARAVLADPEILLLVEPTSAVDAHTEARIAERLREARRNRATIVVTTSPLVLDRADLVAWLVDGVVAAVGTHRQLLESRADYRDTVTRGEES